MPVQISVLLPVVDSCFMTEEELAQEVIKEFTEWRYAGTPRDLTCSVSSVRLQNDIRKRFPNAYERLITKGRWNGKWHRFAEDVAGLHCFTYNAIDYISAANMGSIAVHIPQGEMRCCLATDDRCLILQSDAEMGTLLWENLLHGNVMKYHCYAIAMGAAKDKSRKPTNSDISEGKIINKVQWWTFWRPIPPDPLVSEFVKQISETTQWNERGSHQRTVVSEIAALLADHEPLSKHVSISQLRRHVSFCVRKWRPTTFDLQHSKQKQGFQERYG